ncbi:MAG: STN domain-containing protein, partial [Verrucomicrobiota bacterium]
MLQPLGFLSSADRRRPFARVALRVAVGLGLLIPASRSAAQDAARAFDIPAGEATVTLKRFASQSREQLLYHTDDVGGVQTHAVQGDYVPIAALKVMLAQTRLHARQDAKTRAISIVQRPAVAPPTSPTPLQASPAAEPEPSTMPSRSNAVTRSLAALFSAAVALDSSAQPAPTPPTNAVVELSPFEVTAE